jgi:hypothetical protein
MDSNKENTNSTACGPDCSCTTKKGLSLQTKIVLLVAILAIAGAVLANSLVNKSKTTAEANTSTGYAMPASQPVASSAVVPKDSSVSDKPDLQNVSFKPLASLSALNTDAMDVDGVFILLVKNEAEKTPGILKEVATAKNAIMTHGTRMGTFQLSSNSQDFAMLSAQLQPPGVVVMIKGRGMKGVQGADINQAKLLQAFMGAMQPTSCCPTGGNPVCKKKSI